jgi:hypothetical protein
MAWAEVKAEEEAESKRMMNERVNEQQANE